MLHWPLPTTQITHHLSFTQDKQQRAHIYLFLLTTNIAQQLTRSPDQLPLEWYFYQVSSTILSSTPDPSNSVFTWKDPAQYRKTALCGILFLPERVRLQMTAELINGFAYTFYVPWYRYYTQPPLTSKRFLQDDLKDGVLVWFPGALMRRSDQEHLGEGRLEAKAGTEEDTWNRHHEEVLLTGSLQVLGHLCFLYCPGPHD